MEINSVNSQNVQIQAKNSEKKPQVGAVEKKASKKDKKDLFTETPIRKLGFLDETAFALAPLFKGFKNPVIKNIPKMAIVPATLYMAADVYDKYKKGEDGTGSKPSLKMGFREALYQGVTSVAAPLAIMKSVSKFGNKLLESLPFNMGNTGKGLKSLGEKVNNKTVKEFLSKTGTPAKIIGGVISIIALSKLMKPVDWAAKKLFNRVVDPLLGINKDGDKANAAEPAKEKASKAEAA